MYYKPNNSAEQLKVMTNLRLNSAVMYPTRTESDRPWLPGPPPNRQNRLVEEAESDNDAAGRSNLQIPIQEVSLVQNGSFQTENGPLFRFEELLKPRTGNSKYLFHGCATNINQKTLRSFSKMGPSITFSRTHSYFSRRPAVYWSDTVEFALAWCVFARTGKWKLTPSALSDFECIIYVAEVNFDLIAKHLLMYSIPCPYSTEQEQALVEWCLANVDASGGESRLSPPGTTIAEWDIINSRIPKNTLDGLMEAVFGSSDKVHDLEVLLKAKLYATCTADTSEEFAKCGTKILHVTSDKRDGNEESTELRFEAAMPSSIWTSFL